VGAISATSISEPATQMTLKSFHFAGVASMNITQGVPRMKEIIDAAKVISTPIIEVKLKKEYLSREEIYRKVKLMIEPTYIAEIAEFYKEIYSPKECYLLIQLDQEKIKMIKQLGLEIQVD